MDKRIKKLITGKHKMRVIAILCLLIVYASLQAWVVTHKSPLHPIIEIIPETQQKKTPTNPDKKVIELKQASLLNRRLGSDIEILINDVILFHDGAYMYCDSAYLDRINNTFEAFGTVRVEQGDTLFLNGKYLEYDGNTRYLKVRRDVSFTNTKDAVTLFTDSLDYDRLRNIGYYFEGGMLVDTLNELTSYWGQYEPSKHLALFHDSVILVNPNFKMYTDTLLYNTTTKVADMEGFTTIVSDSATIYTTRGWYNTDTEESLLLDQSRIVNIEGYRSLIGDSIYYDKKQGFGEVFGNMYLEDTIQKVVLTGDYGFYNELTNYAMATKKARAVEFSQGDSLFIHADTLKLYTDSTTRIVRGYYGVRFFRTDLQGVCDSLQFSTQDSVLHMYKDPVLWNENNQILGDIITVYFNDSTIDWAHVRPNAFAIQDLDSLHYNQVKGRDMKAYFENKDIKNVLVEGNAESIFYPEEKDKSMIGLNQTMSSYLSMDFVARKIHRVKIWPKPSGKMTPIPDILPGTDKLANFEWFDYLRPTDKYDIFRKVQKKAGSIQGRGRRARGTSPPPQQTSTPVPTAPEKVENGENDSNKTTPVKEGETSETKQEEKESEETIQPEAVKNKNEHTED